MFKLVFVFLFYSLILNAQDEYHFDEILVYSFDKENSTISKPEDATDINIYINSKNPNYCLREYEWTVTGHKELFYFELVDLRKKRKTKFVAKNIETFIRNGEAFSIYTQDIKETKNKFSRHHNFEIINDTLQKLSIYKNKRKTKLKAEITYTIIPFKYNFTWLDIFSDIMIGKSLINSNGILKNIKMEFDDKIFSIKLKKIQEIDISITIYNNQTSDKTTQQ
jgi:hypothetical protein